MGAANRCQLTLRPKASAFKNSVLNSFFASQFHAVVDYSLQYGRSKVARILYRGACFEVPATESQAMGMHCLADE